MNIMLLMEKVVSLVSLMVEKIFTQFQTLTQTNRTYFFITCFSFSASIPAITNKINPGIPKGIPKKLPVTNTNIP